MQKIYQYIIWSLVSVNLLVYAWYGVATYRANAAVLSLPPETTEIFGEVTDVFKNPLALVQKFAAGAKQDGFSGGLDAVNVPMQEALDKSVARCMAWLDTQPLPGEESSGTETASLFSEKAFAAEAPSFDPKGTFETPNLCAATNYSEALASGGSMTLNELLSKQEDLTARKQLNYERCLNMVGNISDGYQKVWELENEGKRLLTENSKILKELQTEIKAFKEMFTFLIRTPRVYTESDCA